MIQQRDVFCETLCYKRYDADGRLSVCIVRYELDHVVIDTVRFVDQLPRRDKSEAVAERAFLLGSAVVDLEYWNAEHQPIPFLESSRRGTSLLCMRLVFQLFHVTQIERLIRRLSRLGKCLRLARCREKEFDCVVDLDGPI